MARGMMVLLLACLLASASGFGLRAAARQVEAHAAEGHPIEKVITLLQELSAKAETEHKQEEVSFTKFEYWCVDTGKSLQKAITEGKAKMDELSSSIDSYTKNIEVLGKEIDTLSEDLLALDLTKGAANKDRKDGNDLYVKESQTLKDTVKGISDALDALTSAQRSTGLVATAQRKVSAALALVAMAVTEEQRQTLQAFADPKERPVLKAAGNNEGHIKKYAFKSSSVIELLKELKMKFEDELAASNTAETHALNSHTLAMVAHDAVAKAKGESKIAKASEKGEAEGDLTEAKSSYALIAGDLTADESSLSDTQSACSVKKSEWAERSDTRAKEQEALKVAVEILAKVSGVRTEAPGNPILPPSPVSFLQLPNLKNQRRTQRAVELLRMEAKEMKSKVLEKLAATVAAHEEGPFDEVVNMIQKMIFSLANEQKQEDDHKKWCDLEESKTNSSINDKTEKIEELTSRIDEAQARAALLQSQITEASEMVSSIVQHVAEATEIRETGKQENKLAVKDAADAQQSLANAIAVLKDFYKSSGAVKKESWEFVQRGPVALGEKPSTWASGYSGVADPAAQPGGILAVLEQVSADFAKMESQTHAQESSDTEAYQTDMQACEIEKARRSKESDMKSQERKRVVEKQGSLEASRKSVAGELEATEQYMKDLAPACFDGSSTYDERKVARDQEIEALKEAQELLRNQTKAGMTPPTEGPSFLQRRR